MSEATKKGRGVFVPAEVIEMLEAERVHDCRPSLSNTVEVLIREAVAQRRAARDRTHEELPSAVRNLPRASVSDTTSIADGSKVGNPK